MSPRKLYLTAPIPVRLEVDDAADIKEESRETGLAESVIIRRDVKLARRDRLNRVSGNYTKSVDTTGKTQREQAEGAA